MRVTGPRPQTVRRSLYLLAGITTIMLVSTALFVERLWNPRYDGTNRIECFIRRSTAFVGVSGREVGGDDLESREGEEPITPDGSGNPVPTAAEAREHPVFYIWFGKSRDGEWMPLVAPHALYRMGFLAYRWPHRELTEVTGILAANRHGARMDLPHGRGIKEYYLLLGINATPKSEAPDWRVVGPFASDDLRGGEFVITEALHLPRLHGHVLEKQFRASYVDATGEWLDWNHWIFPL